MNTPALPPPQKRRLAAHFGFTGLPFRKNVTASKMYDSSSQRELRHGLHLWLELRGIGLVTGHSGVGKSISLRRLVSELPNERYAVHRIGQIPTTAGGFLRALARRLGLNARRHASDMFEEIRRGPSRATKTSTVSIPCSSWMTRRACVPRPWTSSGASPRMLSMASSTSASCSLAPSSCSTPCVTPPLCRCAHGLATYIHCEPSASRMRGTT